MNFCPNTDTADPKPNMRGTVPMLKQNIENVIDFQQKLINEKKKGYTEYTLEELQFGNAKASICYLDYLQQCKRNFINNEEYEAVPDVDKAIQEEENYLGITDEIKKTNPGGIILQ